MFTHTVELINDSASLDSIVERIDATQWFALDIETVNWWDRETERVALIQIAFREGLQPRVAIIDALAGFDLKPLRQPFEESWKTKVIHNASYDAVKLAHHFGIKTKPIFDTMLAARRSGEKRCSLQVQAEMYLGFLLDKREQRSDWSRRPLSDEQLKYAALDAACTLLLYENQLERGLCGDYELRDRMEKQQTLLPWSREEPRTVLPQETVMDKAPAFTTDAELSRTAIALLGIVTELSGRYSPDQLAVSVGSDRVGLAGWIIDATLGLDADIDENTAKLELTTLCERGLIHLSLSRRLETTTLGSQFWQECKPRK